MTSQPGYQTISIHTLPNISRSKDNQAIKFGQLLECNMRNIEKSYTKSGEETIPRLFSGNRNILMLTCRTLAFTLYKASLKNKESSGTSLPTWFCPWFLKKNISLIIFYYLTKFHCLLYFVKYWESAISWERKELLRWNKKYFSSFLKGFHWSYERNFFGRWEPNFNLRYHEKYFFWKIIHEIWWKT